MCMSFGLVMEKQYKKTNMYLCVYALKKEIWRIYTNKVVGVFFGDRVMSYFLFIFLYFKKIIGICHVMNHVER